MPGIAAPRERRAGAPPATPARQFAATPRPPARTQPLLRQHPQARHEHLLRGLCSSLLYWGHCGSTFTSQPPQDEGAGSAFACAGLGPGQICRAYPRGEDGWVAALQHVLQLLTGGGPASCKRHNTGQVLSPLSQPQVLQPYRRALLAPWHLQRVEWSKASSPKSALGSLKGCHPTAWLCVSPATPPFKGVKLPAWPSSPRKARLSILVKLPVPAGQGVVPKDQQPPVPSQWAAKEEGCQKDTGLSRANWPAGTACRRWTT